jgi:hypothetical protein
MLQFVATGDPLDGQLLDAELERRGWDSGSVLAATQSDVGQAPCRLAKVLRSLYKDLGDSRAAFCQPALTYTWT